MMKTLGLAAIVLSGCAFDGARRLDRPARFQVGVNSRQLARPAGDGFAARSTTPPANGGLVADHATTFDAQFTMAHRHGSYLGVEAEAGTLGTSGSNYAAGYGVAGLELPLARGALGIELAGGRRWLRADLESEDVREWTVEGRAHGRVWLGEKVSFGATLGADPGGSWMAGMSLSVYSNVFNRWGWK
ncbi:MAG: hypothetical protein JNL83_29420 [Myxococcales bacterium]|nr:hypothetical protein [Myxococcales bacterium]